MRDLSQYPFNIRPLSKEEGGGFLISFPDFSDCISDGDTPEEAIRNGMDALRETIATLEEFGFPLPNETTKNALQDALDFGHFE